MKNILVLLLLYIGNTLHAQQNIDMPVQPKPFDTIISKLFPVLKAPMKSMAWIKENDTLQRYELDKKGNTIIEYNFHKNKRTSCTFHSYTGKLKTKSVFTDSRDEIITNYKYTATGKYAEWDNKRPTRGKNDVNSDFKWVFEYDKNDNLKKKYYVDAGLVKSLNTAYTYNDGNQLVEAITHNQWKSVFEYDPKGRLLQRVETLNGSVNDTYLYEYDNLGNVIKESNKYYIANFNYDGNKMVKCTFLLEKGKTEQITLIYKDNLLIEANIHQDDFVTFSPFIISSNYVRSRPHDFRIEFLYDSHKNTKELKYFVNGSYKYSEKFDIAYY